MSTSTLHRQHANACRPSGMPRCRPQPNNCREGGAVTAQIVVAFPVLLFMLLGVIQFAVWSHATHVAQAAAARGLDTTRIVGGTTGSGRDETQSVLDQLDTGPLTGATVVVTRTGQTVSVTVSGTAESIVPFLHLPVHAEADGVAETFSPIP